jgi:Tfp pilus assembly protein PilO
MHSASLSSLLRLESLLEAADQVLSPDLLQLPNLQRLQAMLSDLLQRVTTERLRLEYIDPGSS